MSTPSPFPLSGSYTRESFSALLRGIQEHQHSGVLHLMTTEREATIHFMQGKLAAADFAGLGGVLAFQGLAATESGRYEFKTGFVQFSQIGIEKRIHQSLESLLSSHPLGVSQSTDEVQPLAAFNLEAFDFEALDDHAPDDPASLESSTATMSAQFNEALLSEFVRSVGPAAYVLIDEIALDLRIDLQAMTANQATRLTEAMLGQVPISKRGAFQSGCSRLLEQFKP